MDSEASGRVLDNLRSGSYDGTLLCNAHTSEPIVSADRVYPWEEFPIEEGPQAPSRQTMLPPISNMFPIRGDSAVSFASRDLPGRLECSDQHYLNHNVAPQTLAAPSLQFLDLQPASASSKQACLWYEH